MADSSAIRAGRAFVELFADDTELKKTLDKSARTFKAWGKGLETVGRKLFAGGAALAAPLIAATKVFESMGTSLANMSLKTGASVESLSQLKYAAEQSGVSLDDVGRGFRQMSRFITEAASGNKQDIRVLNDLHLTMAQLARLSPDQQFKLLADAISKIASPTERAGLAMKIFGRYSGDLMALIVQGASGIDEMMKRADALGLTMSTKDALAAKEFGQRLSDLWAIVKMAAFAIGGALAPAVRSISLGLAQGVRAAREFINSHREIIGVTVAVAGGLLLSGAAVWGLGAAFTFVGYVVAGVVGSVTAVGTVLGAILSPLGLVVAGLLGGGYALIRFTNVGQAAVKYLSGIFNTLKDDTVAALAGIRDALAAGDWAAAAGVAWTLIKLEFIRGKAAVLNIWGEIKVAAGDIWGEISTDVQKLWSYALEYLSNWDGVKTAAMKFATWLAATFSNLTNHLADLFQNLFFTTGKKQLSVEMASIDADLKARKITPEVAERQRAAAQATFGDYDDKARAGRDKTAADAYNQRQRDLDAAYAAQHPGLVNNEEAKRAALDAQNKADQARRAQELAAQIAKGAGDVAAARAELARLSAQAHVSNTPLAKGLPAFDPDAAADALSRLGKSAVAGTFNSSAIFGLAGGGAVDRIARFTQDTAKNTRDLVTVLKDGRRPVFH